jgi:hypothetical protein
VLSAINLQSTKAHLRSLEISATAEAAGDPLQEGEARGVTLRVWGRHKKSNFSLFF